MTFFSLLNLLLTFGIFSAVCWRLMRVGRPLNSLVCRSRWAVWGAVHIGIAASALISLMGQLDELRELPLHVLLLKLCLFVLFMYPAPPPRESEAGP